MLRAGRCPSSRRRRSRVAPCMGLMLRATHRRLRPREHVRADRGRASAWQRPIISYVVLPKMSARALGGTLRPRARILRCRSARASGLITTPADDVDVAVAALTAEIAKVPPGLAASDCTDHTSSILEDSTGTPRIDQAVCGVCSCLTRPAKAGLLYLETRRRAVNFTARALIRGGLGLGRSALRVLFLNRRRIVGLREGSSPCDLPLLFVPIWLCPLIRLPGHSGGDTVLNIGEPKEQHALVSRSRLHDNARGEHTPPLTPRPH